MNIIKRDGSEQPFDINKVVTCIKKANEATKDEFLDQTPGIDPTYLKGAKIWMNESMYHPIAEEVVDAIDCPDDIVSIDTVQDAIEAAIARHGYFRVAQNYIKYAEQRRLIRKEEEVKDNIYLNFESIVKNSNEYLRTENANKNIVINSTQRDYMAGEVSKGWAERHLPKDVWDAHKNGIIHFHDSDYFIQRMHNCDLINLEDMLQNGTVISETLIEKPHSFYTACNVTTQIVAQVASSQYGGQSFSLAHLAPFVQVSRDHYIKEVTEEFERQRITASEDQIKALVESRVKDEIKRGIQTIQYQLITLMTTNGQAPFVTMFIYLDEVPEGQLRNDLVLCAEEVFRQRIQGVKNEKGAWITPAFPKIIYVLDEDNIHEDSKYYDLTTLAARCTARRMVPDYISAKVMKELKQGDVYTCMGCRSFLTVEDKQRNPDGSHKFYGRFNQGVVTLNLPDVACASMGYEDKFWKLLDERLELCHRALRCRHERLLGTPSDVAPILWQHGALARLEKGETIDKLLYNGYSTISLGYSGLYECCMRMTGKSHTDPEGKPFALAVMQRLNDACAKWKAEENISYSVYGTPMESTTFKFAKATRERYGIIKDVTDHDYQTNSYHVCVREEIDAFTKLSFESEFQKLSPGGAISYVEVPDLQDNLDAVLAVMRHIYDHIMYAELNTKSDYCQECGYDGEIDMIKVDGKYVWRCPNCGNTNHDTMNIARRVCGYIGTNEFNQGRMGDVHDRVLHL